MSVLCLHACRVDFVHHWTTRWIASGTDDVAQEGSIVDSFYVTYRSILSSCVKRLVCLLSWLDRRAFRSSVQCPNTGCRLVLHCKAAPNSVWPVLQSKSAFELSF